MACERGSFDRQGISVKVVLTPGSVFQWSSLPGGEAQGAIPLMDNVVAYREGQGAPGIVVEDAIALMGLDTRSMPALAATPDIRGYADPAGKTLVVDAFATGNGLLLIVMLARTELRGEDYRLEQEGGVAQRFEALNRRAIAASLFNAPLDAQLTGAGLQRTRFGKVPAPVFRGARRKGTGARPPALGAPSAYYDESFLAQALSRLMARRRRS